MEDSINPFQLSEMLIRNLENANKYHMKYEFIKSVLDDLGITKEQLEEAIKHANIEWDL